MKTIALITITFFFFSFGFNKKNDTNDVVIAEGKMPNMVRDRSNNIHIVYGTGDSIMYVSSKNGKTFSSPALVAILPKLFASAMRGPQIAAFQNGIVITACTNTGNIYSYSKGATGNWTKATKVNDANETAKEALMGLSGDGNNTYAVWLGVKSPRGQNLYGARSDDGGKSWRKNVIVYASPDSTICECCKPSVVVKDNTVYAMFRNWLNGSRDLYVVKSSNGGSTFEQAKKLGEGTWKLKGCPMDGGGLALDNSGVPETVWRREGKIYASKLGMPEKELGEGKGCSIETVNGKKVYAWGLNGDVIVMKPGGTQKNVGKGSLPLIKALNNDQVLCVWENDRQIHASIVDL